MEPTTTVAALPPTYKEMLQEIGRQLKLGKYTLLKRVLLIVWPYSVLIIAGYIFKHLYDYNTFSSHQKIVLVECVAVYIVIAAIYSAVIRFIFKIEKQIWIDSYFDKKNLTPAQSWKMAEKLFWPGFGFRIKLLLQFYFLPVGVTILVINALIFASVKLFPSPDSYNIIASISVVAFFLFVVGLVVYGYYLRTRLRYTWFIFLDKYGTDHSYKTMVDEMNKLNSISKTETFKKSLLATIGVDSAKALAQMAVQTISYGMAELGGEAGQVLGGIVSVVGQETSKQAAELGNISAQYLLYRFARKAAFGEEQSVNEHIYQL